MSGSLRQACLPEDPDMKKEW